MRTVRPKSRNKIKVKEFIIKELPKLFDEEPELKVYVASLFKDQFADKSETEKRIEQILQEIKDLREESERRWQESERRWQELKEESERRWEEHSRAIKNLMEELIKLRKRQDIQIGALGARWGLKSERSFRNALKGLLEESFPIKVERYVEVDREGEVFEGQAGELIELDLIIKDGEVIVGELKSSVSVADVWLFEKKVRFYEKKEGKKVTKKVIISPMIDPRAKGLIERLGIIAYTDVPESEESFI